MSPQYQSAYRSLTNIHPPIADLYPQHHLRNLRADKQMHIGVTAQMGHH